MEINNKIEKIFNYYGLEKQLKHFNSEVYELNEAILANRYDCCGMTNDGSFEHIAEEIADVRVMLQQFQNYYDIPDEIILSVMSKKIDRQIERIEDEEAK